MKGSIAFDSLKESAMNVLFFKEAGDRIAFQFNKLLQKTPGISLKEVDAFLEGFAGQVLKDSSGNPELADHLVCGSTALCYHVFRFLVHLNRAMGIEIDYLSPDENTNRLIAEFIKTDEASQAPEPESLQ